MEKKIFAVLAGLVVLGLFVIYGVKTSAQSREITAPQISTNIVISQFQAGSTTSANDEFVELHNNSDQPFDLSGHRLVYRSASGTTDILFVNWTTSTVVPAGGYYLIASTNYTGSVPANATYDPATCTCSMSATSGGLAVRNGSNAILDSVGWGAATNIFVEAAVTPAAGNSNSKLRALGGCQDTDNNANDFTTLIPSSPRNATTPLFTCSGASGSLFASLSANPSSTSPGGTILFTVTVLPATNPASTGIAVTGNLSTLGLSATQTFLDDGLNGDATAGDNIFSYRATLAANIAGGTYAVSATATDAQARTSSSNSNVTVVAPLPNEDPLLMGNPTGATASIANENNYLMVKPQYTLAYNRSTATPRWTAWRLDSSWIGSTPRQDSFRNDTTLPAGWYQVLSSDYSGSGYDRGHMCPSGDRTSSVADNDATFLMTNMVPQLPANNQGPWEDFESYCRTIVGQGNEIYIISGPVGNIGTVANGNVVVPQYTWKVALILPNGADDLSRVNRATRVIGLIIPNFPPVSQSAAWRQYRTSVKAVEALTGYNFFSNVPKNTAELLKRKRDNL